MRDGTDLVGRHMSLLLLVGPPGSGKTAFAIDQLERAAGQGQATFTIASADVARSSQGEKHLRNGRFASRDRRSWSLDAFLYERDLRGCLAAIPVGTLVIIEDTYGYTADASRTIQEASDRGLEMVVVAPSGAQLSALSGGGTRTVKLSKPCDSCQERPGTNPLIEAESGLAASFCDPASGEQPRKLLTACATC